jgi:uncharacterized membrane protein YccC
MASPAHRDRADRASPPVWRVRWSADAAYRAARATLVVPGLLALTYVVIGNPQMTVYAVFGGFGALVLSSFTGRRLDKVTALAGLAAGGAVLISVGTLVSGHIWAAVLVTIPAAFAVFFAAFAGPNAAAAGTAALLAYVLPVASVGTSADIPSRVEGWCLAMAAAAVAVVVLSPMSAGDRLRAAAARLADVLAGTVTALADGTVRTAARDELLASKHDLTRVFEATPYRPAGLAAADRDLFNVIHLLDWSASLALDTLRSHSDLTDADREDDRLLRESAAAFGDVGGLLAGRPVQPGLKRLRQARATSAAHLRTLTGSAASVRHEVTHSAQIQAIGIAAAAAVAHAMVAAGRAGPELVMAQGRLWLSARPEDQPDPEAAREHPLGRAARLIRSDAGIRSPWFRNSARGAAAIAVAVAVARLTGVQHAFWVVLGTLSVLRTSASATGATALRAIAGTVLGFAVGAALLIGIGASPAALWAAFPIAVLVAAYTPGVAPFVVGQAAFTVTVVVLFNLLVPAGWTVGLVRVEDIVLGCAVSAVVGLLFWPRGASGVMADRLGGAYTCAAAYLSEATDWALGSAASRPGRGDAAVAAGARLDDALRSYLAEQGSKRLAKDDLWALVMGTMRVRLTAHSLASLPELEPRRQAAADPGDPSLAMLRQHTAELDSFYEQLAAWVAPPRRQGRAANGRGGQDRGGRAGEHGDEQGGELALPSAVPEPAADHGDAGRYPEYLWVREHLEQLAVHAADLRGPALRLGRLRRTPWWRQPRPAVSIAALPAESQAGR